MFRYVEDKLFLSRVREVCGKIMQLLCRILNEEYGIGAQFNLVGSGGRNLVTQNESEPIDLDYNLEIVRCENIRDGRRIKECVRKAFNKALRKASNYDLGDCDDSTSALTMKKLYFTDTENKTKFSMDVCIVRTDENGQKYRLIHQKTGFTPSDRYYWIPAPNAKEMRKRADAIKKAGKWAEVRERYLDIKNNYLNRNDHDHPSFVCYIEAVNNVYNKICNVPKNKK